MLLIMSWKIIFKMTILKKKYKNMFLKTIVFLINYHFAVFFSARLLVLHRCLLMLQKRLLVCFKLAYIVFQHNLKIICSFCINVFSPFRRLNLTFFLLNSKFKNTMSTNHTIIAVQLLAVNVADNFIFFGRYKFIIMFRRKSK